MYRNISHKLREWKQKSRRKPLIIRGARQVGKTFSIKEFGEENFSSYILIDFEKSPNFKSIFTSDFDIHRICREIELLTRQKIIVGETLLIFDEIQNAPDALQSLRYFYEDLPELHVIAAGSLLDFTLNELSFPVGRVQFLEMFPMTFNEFLIAKGFEDLSKYYLNEAQISEAVHNELLKHLKEYFFVGGMPESIQVFIDSNSFTEVFEVQNEIINSYKLDFSKYSPKTDYHCLEEVLHSLVKFVGKQIKYSRLSASYSIPTIHKAVSILEMARIIRKVPSVNPPRIPLKASVNSKVFKTIFIDIGLMQNMLQLDYQNVYSGMRLLDIYEGALAEQFVGQQILANHGEVFYWSRQSKSSNAEVDFIIQKENTILPIEVKSAVSGRLKSLHMYIKSFKPEKGIVLSERNYSGLKEQNLEFLPIYLAGNL